MTHHNGDGPFAPRTPEIIGRKKIKNAIKEAIDDPNENAYVFYLTGPGGIGKTRLLEEIGIIKQSQETKSFRWSGIIDLYHNDFHSPSGLRLGIVDGLDPDNEFFQEYRKQRAEFEEKRASGIVGKALEELREELDNIFHNDYKAMSNKHRLVLSIDTLELVQYESDIVQDVCQVEDVDTVIKNWLLENIPKLPNTVTLMAGRVREKIQNEFEEKYLGTGLQFIFKEIEEFTEEEAEAYFDAMSALKPELKEILDKDIQKKVIELTKGRPINLALVIDLLLHNVNLAQILPVNPTQESAQSGEKPQANLGKILVGHLRKLSYPYGLLLDFLALARKGLDADLLVYLTGEDWDFKEAGDWLTEMQKFAFVKTRERNGRRQLFLHDELYDLFDHYYQDDSSFGREFRRIAHYYHTQLETLQSEMESILKMPSSEMDDTKKSEIQNSIIRQIEPVKLALICYEQHINPKDGYHRYFARWGEEAIKGHEIGFDMRLRDETLRFMDRYADQDSEFYAPRIADQINRQDIDRDCAVRWVRRHLIRGQFKIAADVARRVRYSQHPTFLWDEINDDIYKAGLLSAWGEAQIFLGLGRKAIETSLAATKFLEGDKEWSDDQEWWRSRILGRTYSTIGYSHRTMGQYGPALHYYTKALTYLKTKDVEDEKANVINNLAYLLALLGRVDEAGFHVNQALEIRQKIGKRRPIALSLNTLGLIFVLEDHPMWGVNESERALEISLELGDPRSIGLCHIGVGFANRKRGNQWKLGQRIYTFEKCVEFFQAAKEQFLKATEIFSPDNVAEPIRRWETLNELGSLYCDWGWMDWQMGNKPESLSKYDKSIEYHEEALSIAQDYKLEFQELDAYDDLAQVYYDLAFFMAQTDQALKSEEYQNLGNESLRKVLSLIPDSMQLNTGKPQDVESDTSLAHLLALGKAHHRWAVWNFRAVESSAVLPKSRDEYLDRALYHSATAVAYLEKFSPTSFALKNMLKYFSNHLRQVEAPIDWIHEKLKEVESDLDVDLKTMHKNVDHMIGLKP